MRLAKYTCYYPRPVADPLIELAGKLCDLHRVYLRHRVASVWAEQVTNGVDCSIQSQLSKNRGSSSVQMEGRIGHNLATARFKTY